jgi:hypothetical protein
MSNEIVVNFRKIADDIANGYDIIFINEFSDAKETIEAIKEKPRCETCLQENIPNLFKQPNFEETIKIIYGDDVTYDLKTMPSPVVVSTHDIGTWVKEFSEERWEEWWHENVNMEKNRNTKYQFINTYYKPETKTVVASVSYFKKKEAK